MAAYTMINEPNYSDFENRTNDLIFDRVREDGVAIFLRQCCYSFRANEVPFNKLNIETRIANLQLNGEQLGDEMIALDAIEKFNAIS